MTGAIANIANVIITYPPDNLPRTHCVHQYRASVKLPELTDALGNVYGCWYLLVSICGLANRESSPADQTRPQHRRSEVLRFGSASILPFHRPGVSDYECPMDMKSCGSSYFWIAASDKTWKKSREK